MDVPSAATDLTVATAQDPPSLDGVLERFRVYRKAAGLSFSGLALKAGLSRAALLGMDDAGWSPSVETIRALERLLTDEPVGES